MKIEGNHGNFNFRLEKTDNADRLEISSKNQKMHSIAAKTFPNKAEPDQLGLGDRFHRKLLTAFSWKWVKGDENTIINVNSLAKHTGLTKKEIRAAAKKGKLAEKIAEKLTETAHIEKQKKVAPFKAFPVKNEVADRVLGRAAGYKDGQIETVQIYWSPDRKAMLASGDYLDKPYMYRQELDNTYQISAQVYRENNVAYLLLDTSKMTHIEAREFRDGTLATWEGPNPTSDKQAQIFEEIHQYINKEK